MMEMGRGTKSFLNFQVMFLSTALQYALQSLRIPCPGGRGVSNQNKGGCSPLLNGIPNWNERIKC